MAWKNGQPQAALKDVASGGGASPVGVPLDVAVAVMYPSIPMLGPVEGLSLSPTIPFQFAADQGKQLLTLATGLLALTVTFRTNTAGKRVGYFVTALSMFALLVSILAGILNLGAITHHVHEIVDAGAGRSVSIMAGNVLFLGQLQTWAFFIAAAGLGLTFLLPIEKK